MNHAKIEQGHFVRITERGASCLPCKAPYLHLAVGVVRSASPIDRNYAVVEWPATSKSPRRKFRVRKEFLVDAEPKQDYDWHQSCLGPVPLYGTA